ncbi:putative isopenicillin N synthetase [Eremomyces bilateralis CBS 781.70]|uniref:Isopenicillin N synthetase n=1 Tax=Eremomyces bilateralis CBS 781.70 TaxID=1392243 RepID=A0A6G1G1C6_9PEZI|nr:putative isopenicillin N synthetase [Eremomyces bilateralis CBS 781.70]KAF1811843.1 putative isopenicillin N synthetase [Eremomyces bilateralis CBS 781.70]
METPKVIHLTNGNVVTIKSNTSTTLQSIPLINVEKMHSPNLKDRQAVAEEIRAASHEIGFFLITNHGVDMNLASGVLDQAKQFFALPKDKKMEVYTGRMPSEFCGYHPMQEYNINGSKLKDLHEAYNWNYDASKDPGALDPNLPSINLWPSGMPEFQEKLCAYQTSLIKLARQLTRIFALALYLPETAFDDCVRVPEAGMRILHYPAQTAARADQNGIGAHTDVETFTIITQDSPGLEVLSKSGQWIQIQPVPGSFVVNIADCFMRQTNDFFVSTVHRVINQSGNERYSAPFFWGFNRQCLLTPIETCVSEENPSKYPLMTAGEYYEWRTRRQKKEWKDGPQK